jgi:hypothetical protein
MLDVPYVLGESIDNLMERAKLAAIDRWGNLAEFEVQFVPGEQIAKVTLSGHTFSMRWDMASGNVSDFYRRLRVLAQTHWGPDSEYKVLLRQDGYADVILTDRR